MAKTKHSTRAKRPHPTKGRRTRVAPSVVRKTATAAGRNRVKTELAKRAAAAFSDVFNGVFPLAAQEAPRGNVRSFARWHLQAFRAELEDREAQLRREGWLP